MARSPDWLCHPIEKLLFKFDDFPRGIGIETLITVVWNHHLPHSLSHDTRTSLNFPTWNKLRFGGKTSWNMNKLIKPICFVKTLGKLILVIELYGHYHYFKNFSQIGSFPQIRVNIKKYIWKHNLVDFSQSCVNSNWIRMGCLGPKADSESSKFCISTARCFRPTFLGRTRQSTR